MKKCIVISDSFKGTISSLEIAHIVKKSINERFKKCKVIEIPIADGGEGTVDAFNYFLKGRIIKVKVSNPYFKKIEAKYLLYKNTAFIEMASAAGLPLVGKRMNPLKTTTYGVGEIILDAIKKGAKKIILGLGGSSTNDGGCGCASALKTKFVNSEGKKFIPTGETLKNIEHIDISETERLLKNVEIICMSDVNNPMHGKQGAAYIFAPQKGANKKDVIELDEGLINLDKVIQKDLHKNISSIKGAGAAGALGAGAIAFFHAKIESGIETLLKYSNFDKELNHCDLVISGEGKFDNQSLNGKVISGIKKHCAKKNVPLIIIAGGIDSGVENTVNKKIGINCLFSSTRKPISYEKLIPFSKEFYKSTIDNILNLIKISENFKK